MIGAVARRVFSGLAAIVLASLLAFVILEAAPGDAVSTLLGDTGTGAQELALRQQLGLDRPLALRYLDFFQHALRGDLGRSVISGRPVAALIGQRFANTLLLAGFALLLALGLGLSLGLWAAARHNRPADLLVLACTAVCLSIPAFGVAILLTQLFSVRLGWLPSVGGGSLRHLLLPGLSLALPTAAVIARMARAAMLEAARQPYATAVRAKGLTMPQVWRKHIFRNALLPVLALVGVQTGHLLGGAFIVETLFAWPGLGRLTVQAIFDNDTPVVLGSVLLSAVVFQLTSLLVDLCQSALDPRLRVEE